ncbi:hypothetical protein D3C79_1025900 [compost metagenome]
MIGRMNNAPIRMNNWLVGGDAAAHRLIDGGTMFGQILNARPMYPRNTSIRVKANGQWV